MAKEIILTIKDGNIDAQLGQGWPQGSEAADVVKPFMKGLAEVTVKSHRPHHHHNEEEKAQVTN